MLVLPPPRAAAQPVSVTATGGALKIRAAGFSFLKGQPLARLKDGRSVRVEVGVMVLPEPGKSPLVTARRVFSVSYDLWEERFAVATVESRPRRISHVTSAAAEVWCLEQLSIPLDALGRDTPFWIRLEYRILDGDGPANSDEGSGFTLQALIDVLSRRRSAELPGEAIDAGPFRLARSGGSASASVPP